MPILNDLMDHDITGPAIQQRELIAIRRLIAKRFGPYPPGLTTASPRSRSPSSTPCPFDYSKPKPR
jgi:hypothetical protein